MRRSSPDAAMDVADNFDIPAPVGGWNARDSIAAMGPMDAVLLDNWFPRTTTVDSRPGSTDWASVPAGSTIETLMGVAKYDGTSQLFAAAATGIYDVTAGGAVAAVSSAATSGRWQFIQINVGGTAYLWACCGDGVNGARVYNSTTNTWVTLTGASIPALIGLTGTDVANVSMWKYRLILCERNSLKFWYGPLNSVGGVFNSFDLGQVFAKGGYLVATANWTIDGGNGVDDLFVAITSEGEVAVYQGTDPSGLATFALQGVYSIGKPLGKRCFEKVGGDLAVLTEEGLFPLSRALLSASVDKRVALSDKIQGAFNEAASRYKANFGWQVTLLPKGPAVLVNVPLNNVSSVQFVMNTVTGAWCRFLNWNSTCMLVQSGKLYFASANQVKEGWSGTKDGTAAIQCTAATAFSYGPTRYRKKKINLVRPLFQSTASVSVGLALDTDFYTRTPFTAAVSVASNAGLWDVGLWDSALWGGYALSNQWRKIFHKPGKTFSFRMRMSLVGVDVQWFATDFICEAGSILS